MKYFKQGWAISLHILFYYITTHYSTVMVVQKDQKGNICTCLQLLMWLWRFYTSTFVFLQLSGEFSLSVYMHIHNVACYLLFPASAHDPDITWNIFAFSQKQGTSLQKLEHVFVSHVQTSAAVWLTGGFWTLPSWPSVQWPYTINLFLLIFCLR